MNYRDIAKLWLINPKDVRNAPLSLLRLGFSGIFIGFTVGLIIAIFRISSSWAFSNLGSLIQKQQHDSAFLSIMFFVYILAALTTGILIKKYKAIRYGGMPWDEAVLYKNQAQPPRKILLTKFIGSWLVMAAGISVGREGPSIQMGASAALGLGQSDSSSDTDRDFFVLAGCSAGLSSAFSAPLSGIFFVFEKMRTKFSWLLLYYLLAGAVGMSVSVIMFFDLGLMLPLKAQNQLKLYEYAGLIPLGVVCGAIGLLYAALIRYSKKIYSNQKIFPEISLPLFPFLGAALMFLFYPLATGEGLDILSGIKSNAFLVDQLLFFLVIKLVFTAFCYGSGIPAGLMVPLFCVGGVSGGIYHSLMNSVNLLPGTMLQPCIVMGMAASFAAAEQAPLTGCILILEMTGAYVYTPGLLLCALVGLVMALFLRGKAA